MKKLILMLAIGTLGFAANAQTTKEENKKEKTQMQKGSVYYTCPMHPDVKMDKPGKCPKCGMTLEKKTMKMTQTKKQKMEAMKTYICPMHPNVKSDKPGKCPECGMDLVEKK